MIDLSNPAYPDQSNPGVYPDQSDPGVAYPASEASVYSLSKQIACVGQLPNKDVV